MSEIPLKFSIKLNQLLKQGLSTKFYHDLTIIIYLLISNFFLIILTCYNFANERSKEDSSNGMLENKSVGTF